MRAFRIVHRKWSGRLQSSGYPARWNSAGTNILYTADSRALACLENLVHRGTNELTGAFVCMVISIPEASMDYLDEKELPKGWNQPGEQGSIMCRPLGDTWYRSGSSLVLKVPSAIIPGEFNYLINTVHPEFHKIRLEKEENFLFDTRIKKR